MSQHLHSAGVHTTTLPTLPALRLASEALSLPPPRSAPGPELEPEPEEEVVAEGGAVEGSLRVRLRPIDDGGGGGSGGGGEHIACSCLLHTLGLASLALRLPAMTLRRRWSADSAGEHWPVTVCWRCRPAHITPSLSDGTRLGRKRLRPACGLRSRRRSGWKPRLSCSRRFALAAAAVPAAAPTAAPALGQPWTQRSRC